MKTLFDSLVRTYVPWLAGVIVTWLVSLGVPLDPEVAPALLVLLTGAASGLYYLVARLLETHVSPKFGWLLGLAKQPDYFKRVKVVEDGQSFTVRVDGPAPITIDGPVAESGTRTINGPMSESGTLHLGGDVEQIADLSAQGRYPLHGEVIDTAEGRLFRVPRGLPGQSVGNSDS